MLRFQKVISLNTVEISGSCDREYGEDYSGILRRVVSQKLTDVSEVLEAVSTSETSVNLHETTRRKIPDDSHLQFKNRSISELLSCCNFPCSVEANLGISLLLVTQTSTLIAHSNFYIPTVHRKVNR
jgi:hypothetical protein